MSSFPEKKKRITNTKKNVHNFDINSINWGFPKFLSNRKM